MKISLMVIAKDELKSSKIIIPKINLIKFDQICLIDGHSTDGTDEYYHRLGFEIHRQKVKGLGGAVFEARKRCKTDAFTIFHPDGNENYKELYKFKKIFENGADLIIPTRMIKGSFNEEDNQILKPRKWFNQGLALIANVLWGTKKHKITDPTQGLRAITTKAYDKLKLDMSNLTIDYQMVIRALKKKINIVEYPTKEGKRLFGTTNFKSIPTGIAELKMLYRELLIGNNF